MPKLGLVVGATTTATVIADSEVILTLHRSLLFMIAGVVARLGSEEGDSTTTTLLPTILGIKLSQSPSYFVRDNVDCSAHTRTQCYSSL